MASNINLIPRDMAPKASVLKASGAVKKLLTVGFLVFILMAIGITAFYVFYTRELNSLKGSTKELTERIQALQQTEQRLLLVKDRIDKAKVVLGTATASDQVDSATKLMASLPQEVSLSSAQIKPESSELILVAPNTPLVSQVLKTVTSSGLYKVIEMKSFRFSPVEGFSIGFHLAL